MKINQVLKLILLTLGFGIIISLIFRGLEKAFFQQDEWGSFGNYFYRMSLGNFSKAFIDSILASGKVHVNPVSEWLWYLQYEIFGLNFHSYAYVSMIIHLANTLLVYYLSIWLIKNKRLSILVAILFCVNSISHQAVTWVSASLQTQGAILFSLLFSVFFFNYLTQVKKSKKLLYLAILNIFIALLFKETALPFFLLPVLLVFYAKEKSLKFLKDILLPIGIALAVYLLLRIIIFINARPIILGLTEVLEQPNPIVHVYRLFSLPFKVLPESVFPTEHLLNFSRTIIGLAYTHFIAPDGIPNPYLVETAGLDLVNYVLSLILLLNIYLCYRIFKNQKQELFAKALIVSLVVIIGSTVLIIFFPGKAGYASIIEPRYLYGATFGSSLFLVLGFYAFFSYLVKNKGKALLITTIFLLPLINLHIRLVRRDLSLLEARGNLRKSLLVAVKKAYPVLPKKAVFYLESDQAYYGLPEEEKNLPVQSGFGRMLMVWYQETEKFPGCFYKDFFLFDLIAQGYRECDGRGFGYFRDYNQLIEALRENHLSANEVFAFSWKGKTKEFKNITNELRTKLND